MTPVITASHPKSTLVSQNISRVDKRFKNVMTIDLEDWFHVTNFENHFTRKDWDDLPCRIPHSLPKLLDLLQKYNARATFFTLGWVAERFPELIKRIRDEGHEMASHGDEHRLITSQSPEEFRAQLLKSKDIIEQITGERIYGHRAPSYSLRFSTVWAFEVLAQSGFTYDSSVFPFGNRRDNDLCTERFPCHVKAGRDGLLAEYPLSTAQFLHCNLPIAGGGYFRFLPYSVIKWSVEHLNRQGHPAIMYLHPWEIDPEQPRVHQASWLARFRHYHQLEKTEQKLESLLKDFSFGSIRDIFWSPLTERYELTPQV